MSVCQASQFRPGLRNAVSALDRTALRRVAENHSRLLHRVMPWLRLANHGLLWTGLAIGLWVTGDRRARRAAWRGIGGMAAAERSGHYHRQGPGRPRPGGSRRSWPPAAPAGSR